MLNSLRLQNFKRFRDVRFDKFQRVNLLTGKNNCGKTSVLEAILLLLDWENSLSKIPLVLRPGGDYTTDEETATLWKWMFPNCDVFEAPEVSGQTADAREVTVRLVWRPGGQPPFIAPGMGKTEMTENVLAVTAVKESGTDTIVSETILDHSVGTVSAESRDPSQEAQDYARVAITSDAEEKVEEMLRKIEPRLKSIRSLQPYGNPSLYVGIEGLPARIPAIQLGHGFSRLLSIMAEIVASQKPVILIDEIENGLHHSALIDIWRGLLTACEHSDVQIFATTHSWECVAAAHQAFSESLEYPLAVFRLEAGKDDVSVVAYDRESLQYSIEHDWEVR